MPQTPLKPLQGKNLKNATPRLRPRAELTLILVISGLAALRTHRESPLIAFPPLEADRAPWYRFATLPGCGARTALGIVRHREDIGRLHEPGELKRAAGVGSRRLHAWSPWLRFHGRPHGDERSLDTKKPRRRRAGEEDRTWPSAETNPPSRR